MNQTITYREFQAGDYEALEDIISSTWHYGEFCSPKAAKKMAGAYLAGCLANQTYTCVAVEGLRPVGIIMGKNNQSHKVPLKFRMRQISKTVSLLLNREGRTAAHLFGGIEQIDRELLEETKRNFGGELAFFAIHPDMRGKGVGKELFSRLLNYMQSENLKDFYLYTDTSCNYGFYEHQNMKRLGEKSLVMEQFGGKEMSFFLYGYDMLTGYIQVRFEEN